MERIDIPTLEKMAQSKYVSTSRLKLSDNLFGDNKKRIIDFDIFDGFAYGVHENKELYMIFPKKSFIKESKEMKNEIREFCELKETDEITEIHILIAYNSLFENKIFVE